MTLPIRILLALTLFGTPALSQGMKQSDKSGPLRQLVRPPVAVVIQGEFLVDSMLVRAQVDIDYRNPVDSPLNDLILVFPHAGTWGAVTGEIDSLLVNGAPLRGIRDCSDSVIRISLDSPLPPQETLHLLLSYRCSVGTVAGAGGNPELYNLTDWYPRIVPAGADRLIAAGNYRRTDLPDEYADFLVSLAIDSSLMAAGTGELLNEKELLGVLPRSRDTVVIDVLAHPEREGELTLGKLPARTAKRRWLWRAESQQQFSVVIAPQFHLDRVIADSCVIDLYYPESFNPADRSRLAHDVSMAERSLHGLTGRFPFAQTSLVGIRRIDPLREVTEPVLFRFDEFSPACQTVSATEKIAQYYVGTVQPGPGGRFSGVSRGIANFLAIESLHENDPKRGYDNYIDNVRALCYGSRYSAIPLSGLPFSWMRNVAARRTCGAEDSLLLAQFVLWPARLQMFRNSIGDSAFWPRLNKALEPSNSGSLTDSAFVLKLADSGGLLGIDPRCIDLQLENMRVQDTESGVLLSGNVHLEAVTELDVSLAVLLTSGDTVFLPIHVDGGVTKSTAFSVRLPSRPIMAILDPQYKFPDRHRNSNIFYWERRPGHRDYNSSIYPAFRLSSTCW